MKNAIISFTIRLRLLLFTLSVSGYTFAQDPGSQPVPQPQHSPLFPFRFFVPFIVIAIVTAVILYAGYRYWQDNGPHKKIKQIPK